MSVCQIELRKREQRVQIFSEGKFVVKMGETLTASKDVQLELRRYAKQRVQEAARDFRITADEYTTSTARLAKCVQEIAQKKQLIEDMKWDFNQRALELAQSNSELFSSNVQQMIRDHATVDAVSEKVMDIGTKDLQYDEQELLRLSEDEQEIVAQVAKWRKS